MATLSQTKICLFWYRIISSGGNPLVAGSWNNDSRANPDTLEGGIPFNQGGCLTEPIYLTACGTGDAGIIARFAPPFASPIPYIPTTYLPGWPTADGRIDAFDATALQGSAVLSNNNRSVSFPTSPGVCRSTTGWTQGRFYVEYEVTYDIFSSQTGMGAMRRDTQINFAQNGRLNVSDNFGGSMLQGGSIADGPPAYLSHVNTFNTTAAATTLLGAPSTSIFALAVAIIPQYQYVPTPFSAVKIPDLICCPIQRHAATQLLVKRSGRP